MFMQQIPAEMILNDITSKIITIGHYTFDQVGEYDIKYKVTDAIGSVAEKTVKLKVVE